jgi:transcriptional regulator with XRE-family HTH domain
MRDLLMFEHQDRPHRRSPLLRTMVGDVLRRTRLEQGRTLSDVARSARISMQYLSELERGRKEASSEILAALCAALRLDLSELLAAVGRDLFDRRAPRSPVVRLDAFRDGDARARADVTTLDPLLPAEDSIVDSSPARGPSARVRTVGDAACRLAA